MSERIQCKKCEAKINVPDGWTQPRARCPRCQAILFRREQAPTVAAVASALAPATGERRSLAMAAIPACVRLGKVVLAQALETVVTTADQTRRIARVCLAVFDHRRRRRQEAGALIALGDQLARQGLGEAAIRGKIAELDGRPQGRANGNGSPARLAAERKVLTGGLAVSWLDSDGEVFPAELGSYRNRAIHGRSKRIAADEELAAARAALWPRERAPLLRAGFGWSVVAGIFGLLSLACLDRTPRGRSEPALLVAGDPSASSKPSEGSHAAFTSPIQSGAGRSAGGSPKQPGTNSVGRNASKELGNRFNVPVQPSQAEPFQEQANQFLQQGQYDRAIAACNEAIRHDPRFHLAFFTRGLAFSLKGENQKAIGDMTRAIQLAPNVPPYLANRANVYIKVHKLNLAIADCNKAIRLNDQFADAYGHRGIAFSGKGDNKNALSDFNAAIRLDPTIKEPWNNRAAIRNEGGEFDRAIADCNEAIHLDPGYASAWNNRAHAYGKKGDLEKALTDASEAIRLDPANQSAWGNRGLFWLQKHKLDKAIADLNEAIRLDPQDAAAFANRGLCFRAKGDESRAQADFARYRALNGAPP